MRGGTPQISIWDSYMYLYIATRTSDGVPSELAHAPRYVAFV